MNECENYFLLRNGPIFFLIFLYEINYYSITLIIRQQLRQLNQLNQP